MEEKRVRLFVATVAFVATVGGVSGTRWIVGSNMGWSSNVNYSVWAQDKHFYNGDWLFFVYDRKQMNVLEVNKTDYESCSSDHVIHNWTTGAGRDVVPLNVSRNYYFISGKGGLCTSGMKLAVEVENPSPSPHLSLATSPIVSIHVPAPVESSSSISSSDDVPPPTDSPLIKGTDEASSPAAIPMSNDASPTSSILGLGSSTDYVLPAVVAIGALWDLC